MVTYVLHLTFHTLVQYAGDIGSLRYLHISNHFVSARKGIPPSRSVRKISNRASPHTILLLNKNLLNSFGHCVKRLRLQRTRNLECNCGHCSGILLPTRPIIAGHDVAETLEVLWCIVPTANNSRTTSALRIYMQLLNPNLQQYSVLK